MNKAQRILIFISEAGIHGRSYTEIQQFICKMNGKEWDLFSSSSCHLDKATNRYVPDRQPQIGPGPGLRRANRGIYGTNLDTLLPAWCYKNPGGKWVLWEWPMGAIYRQEENTKAGKFNKTMREGKWAQHVATLPSCPSCRHKHHNYKHDRIWNGSDGTVCLTMGAGGFSVDCKNRVWVDASDEHFFLTKLFRPEAEAIYSDRSKKMFNTWDDERAWVVNQILLANARKS